MHHNLLYIYPRPNLGGVHSAFLNRIRALKSVGCKADMLFYRDGVGLNSYESIDTYVLSETLKIEALIKSKEYTTIVWINQLRYLKALLERKVLDNVPVLLEIRGMVDYLEDLIINELPSVKEFIKAIIVPAKHLKEKVDKLTNNSIPCININNCIDTKRFHYFNSFFPESIKPPTINSKNRLITWIGTLNTNKNWLELLRIARNINNSSRHTYDIWVITEWKKGSGREAFKEKCVEFGLCKRIHVFDSIPYWYMPFFYSAIRKAGGVILSTSLSEGCQNIILESYSCGCRIVSVDNDAAKESIIHNKTGMLYPLGNIEKAIKAIEKMAGLDELQLKAMLNHQWKKFISNYTYESVMNNYLVLLNNIQKN